MGIVAYVNGGNDNDDDRNLTLDDSDNDAATFVDDDVDSGSYDDPHDDDECLYTTHAPAPHT